MIQRIGGFVVVGSVVSVRFGVDVADAVDGMCVVVVVFGVGVGVVGVVFPFLFLNQQAPIPAYHIEILKRCVFSPFVRCHRQALSTMF